MPFQPFWTLIIIIWNITDLATISCPLHSSSFTYSYLTYYFFPSKIFTLQTVLIRPHLSSHSSVTEATENLVSIITQNCWQWGSNTLVYFAPLTLTPLSATYTFTHKKKRQKGLNPRVARNMDGRKQSTKRKEAQTCVRTGGSDPKRKHISLIMINNHLLASINSQ